MSNVIPLRRHTPPQQPGALHPAYQHAHMNEACPHCAAPAGEDCRRDDGEMRFFPCVARLHNNNNDPTTDPPRLRAVVRDFSEPRHRQDDAVTP
jgi:hypothetical protein